MAEYIIQDSTLTGIADAIRAKTGSTEAIGVADMASQIEGIQAGGGDAPDAFFAVYVPEVYPRIEFIPFKNGMTWAEFTDSYLNGLVAMPDFSNIYTKFTDYRGEVQVVYLGSQNILTPTGIKKDDGTQVYLEDEIIAIDNDTMTPIYHTTDI